MPASASSPPAAAMLLVLLPLAQAGEGPAARAALGALQQQLGPAVRVLHIDAAAHPAVVRSFHVPALPAWVLVRQGVELGRQPGLPTAETVAALLGAAALKAGVDSNQARP